MHNGLARKEDFTFITYYCPHCNALNGSRQHEDHELVANSGKESPSSHSDGCTGLPGASLASSGAASPVASSLPTVEELPADDSGDKVSSDEPAS
uniref:Lunapark zinc ribbon domain-containing protein n=1 Tax=Arundo donax TaxID=35708 RepID=A0A0A9EVP3_ARUDO